MVAALLGAPGTGGRPEARASSAPGSSISSRVARRKRRGRSSSGPDSSASYGNETVRWRLVGDSLALALGGEWVNYRLKLKGKRLTLSGGDLTEPVTFERVGPPSPRPDSDSGAARSGPRYAGSERIRLLTAGA